jgi:thiamine pyrophosphate-dependent acetolactate synthase large subunit-like protein
MGAKVGRPEATVWAICGDGGFQMTMQELGTIVEERIEVKIAIINNGYLGMVRQWQDLFFDNTAFRPGRLRARARWRLPWIGRWARPVRC